MQQTPPSSTEPTWKPKAIIFDLLTALLDSWSLWNISAGSPENGLKWRNRYLELTFGCGAYKPYEDLVRQAASDIGLHPIVPARLLADWDDLKPWPEVDDVLEKLRERGWKMGVVTNCSIGLGRRAANIVGEWDAVVTAEEVG
jgi:2-haloacid dehalogenase